MSTSVAAASRVGISARTAAWAGIVLGALAWYIALPPLLLRTPVPSVLVGLVAVAAGAYAIRED
ncbi:MAG TPA: hypothetical protein VER75_01280, partial [Thermoleophilaceae bacterium]|nr:hypothetical protein [Thermoleophilaceae bacterium]